MSDASGVWAAKLREIASAVRSWEERDVGEQKARGDRKLHRPRHDVTLDELATALDGECDRFSANVTARQNWPRTVNDFERDWRIARLVHRHRTDPNSTVGAGKQEAQELPMATEAIVDEADKRYRRYFIDGTAEVVFLFLRMKAARYPIKHERGQGENQG